MTLQEINAYDFGVGIELAYATQNNFTGQPIYIHPVCYLHKDALIALVRARDAASFIGFKLIIYDAFRPTEAQQKLWNHTPDERFLAHPQEGSPHSRGVAVDLTLADASECPWIWDVSSIRSIRFPIMEPRKFPKRLEKID